MKTISGAIQKYSNSLMSSSELRRINKPIVEKKRRERINGCLEELKAILLQSTNKRESSASKLEKADILEMAVRHLRGIQRRSPSAPVVGGHSDETSFYKDGYNDCAREVASYLSQSASLTQTDKSRVLSQLSSRLSALNSTPSSLPSFSPYPTDDTCGSYSSTIYSSTAAHGHCYETTPGGYPSSLSLADVSSNVLNSSEWPSTESAYLGSRCGVGEPSMDARSQLSKRHHHQHKSSAEGRVMDRSHRQGSRVSSGQRSYEDRENNESPSMLNRQYLDNAYSARSSIYKKKTTSAALTSSQVSSTLTNDSHAAMDCSADSSTACQTGYDVITSSVADSQSADYSRCDVIGSSECNEMVSSNTSACRESIGARALQHLSMDLNGNMLVAQPKVEPAESHVSRSDDSSMWRPW